MRTLLVGSHDKSSSRGVEDGKDVASVTGGTFAKSTKRKQVVTPWFDRNSKCEGLDADERDVRPETRCTTWCW